MPFPYLSHLSISVNDVLCWLVLWQFLCPVFFYVATGVVTIIYPIMLYVLPRLTKRVEAAADSLCIESMYLYVLVHTYVHTLLQPNVIQIARELHVQVCEHLSLPYESFINRLLYSKEYREYKLRIIDLHRTEESPSNAL